MIRYAVNTATILQREITDLRKVKQTAGAANLTKVTMQDTDQMASNDYLEENGVVMWKTEWGRWWQTLREVIIEVDLPQGTRGKDIKVVIEATRVECALGDRTFFAGLWHSIIHPGDSTWSVEDQKILLISVWKVNYMSEKDIWTSLLVNQYNVNTITLHEMTKKLDLERFQLLYPSLDFSRAKLAKPYDKPRTEEEMQRYYSKD